MAQNWGFGPAAPNGNLFPGPGDPGFNDPNTRANGWPSAQAPGLFGPLQNMPWQTPPAGPQGAPSPFPGNMALTPGVPMPQQQGGAAMMPGQAGLGGMLGGGGIGSGMHYAPGDPLAAAQNPFATGGQGAGAGFSGQFLPGGAPWGGGQGQQQMKPMQRPSPWGAPMGQTSMPGRAFAGGTPGFSEMGQRTPQPGNTLASIMQRGNSGRGWTFS